MIFWASGGKQYVIVMIHGTIRSHLDVPLRGPDDWDKTDPSELLFLCLIEAQKQEEARLREVLKSFEAPLHC